MPATTEEPGASPNVETTVTDIKGNVKKAKAPKEKKPKKEKKAKKPKKQKVKKDGKAEKAKEAPVTANNTDSVRMELKAITDTISPITPIVVTDTVSNAAPVIKDAIIGDTIAEPEAEAPVEKAEKAGKAKKVKKEKKVKAKKEKVKKDKKAKEPALTEGDSDAVSVQTPEPSRAEMKRMKERSEEGNNDKKEDDNENETK